MIVTNDQQHNDDCIICHERNGTLISAHNNEIAHMYHLGCLALALYKSPANRNCQACTNPLKLTPEHQQFIDSPSTVFLYACKCGLTNLAADILQTHSLPSCVIQTGFACATFGNHTDVIQMLFDKHYLVNESAVTCLSIAMQQKNLELVKLWYKSCSENDLLFDRRIITEDQSYEIFCFLDNKISRRIYCFFPCFLKVLRCGNIELAHKMINWIRPGPGNRLLESIKQFWNNKNNMTITGTYLITCEASMWGDLDSLKLSKEKGYFLYVPGNLHTICAHFMGHSEVELFLKSKGYKLERKSLFYKLAEACAKSNMTKLKEHIAGWQQKNNYTLEDVMLKLMLLLSVKNENILMLECILSKCRLLTFGIMDVFEYAVDRQKLQIVLVFLKKFDELAYFAVARGSFFNKERFVEEVLPFLRQDHRRAAFLKAFQYGVIYQNLGLVRLAKNWLNL